MRRGKRIQIQGLCIRLIRDRVPVVVAFIKSDLGFPQISGPDGVNSQFQDRATSRAYVQFDQLCRLLFRWEPEDVPAELISGDYFLLLGMAF